MNRDFYAENFGKCKFGFLQQAFVPYIKDEVFNGADLLELEEIAEVFAMMSMRILDKPKVSSETKTGGTGIDDNMPPLDAYDEEIDFLLDNYRVRLVKLYHKIDAIVDSMDKALRRASDYPEDLTKDHAIQAQQFLEDIGKVLQDHESLFNELDE